jgi:osmoprotectant transport system permease protein
MLMACVAIAMPANAVVIGSKVFTESVILGELGKQLLQGAGQTVEHRKELGGTRILWSALLRGDIDCYPEYTGTLRAEIFANQALDSDAQLTQALARQGVWSSRPLGFNNTYVLGMRRDKAQRLHIERISQLAQHAQLRFGFSNEFIERQDGWLGLRERYRLPQQDVRGLAHDLAYRGLASDALDLTDLYSTDAEIAQYDLVALEDDVHFFPVYEALFVCRHDVAQSVRDALDRLGGKIDASAMSRMNARAKLEKQSEGTVAADFLRQQFAIDSTLQSDNRWARIARHTREHLAMVAISLGAAILIATPLGALAFYRRGFGRVAFLVADVLQTLPALALLVFLIPWLGIGYAPAIVALFLYSLLPILRNTHAGLADIPRELRESASALGLSTAARLRLIELPLAARSILAGIRTAAVINVGTATLGALVGAGGYGQPILTGIRLDDLGLILEGAIPAASLALLVQALFALLERRWVVAR